MMFSSSLFVIIITGTSGLEIFIRDRVSNPLIPGMFSSSIIRSKFAFSAASRASRPLFTVTTSYPFCFRNMICGFSRSISSSAQSIVPLFIVFLLFFFVFGCIFCPIVGRFFFSHIFCFRLGAFLALG